MVKLAQHISWPSSKTGEGTSSSQHIHSKKAEVLANGNPRRTLAELFEARATSSSSASTPSSSSSPSTVSSMSSSSVSAGVSSSAVSLSSASSVAHAHVTFQEKVSVVQQRRLAKSAELGDGIKRSTSGRKVADSSVHDSTPSKKTSKSGPLLWSTPSAAHKSELPHIEANSLHQHYNSPSKLTDGHVNGNTVRESERIRQQQRTQATNISGKEQRNRSPLMRFQAHEHSRKDFLMKSIDTVENLKNLNRFRQNEKGPFAERKPSAESVDGVQRMQDTPTKGKKVRKGLFGLLGDSNSGAKTRNSDSPARRTGDKVGVEARELVSPVRRVSGNLGNHFERQAQDFVTPKKVSGNLGKHGGNENSKSLTIEIPEKMVGLTWFGVQPQLLVSGSYNVPSEGFMLEQVLSERSSYIKHGNLHRVRIHEGHLGVAWIDGQAVLLEAGVSVHVCPPDRFSYITTDDKMLSEKEFVLGPFRVVSVHDDEVGIKFCNRQPQILYSGRHCLSISKVEVFAGFESLRRRQSIVTGARAMSSDNVPVSGDVLLEWQIKAEDAAAARLANVTDVEGAITTKVRRAFNLIIWEVNSQDLKSHVMGVMENGCLQISKAAPDSHLSIKALSSKILRESMDLFEEGWTVTIWDLQLQKLVVLSEAQDAQG